MKINKHKKTIRDLNSDLGHDKESNEEMEDELERKEEEIKHLNHCVKNRDDITNKWEFSRKEQIKLIN